MVQFLRMNPPRQLKCRRSLALFCAALTWTGSRATLLRAETGSRTVQILDVMRVSGDQPASSAVLTLSLPAHPEEIRCDVLVVGASTGGVAAALAAVQGGHAVCLTEETSWIGGQMTAQGVSALDENRFIESAGGTASYLKLRDAIRQFYRQYDKLSGVGAGEKRFNPGNCWVSALCFEPQVALKAIGSMLQPYQARGLLGVYLRTKAVSAERAGDRVSGLLTYGFENHRWIIFRPRYLLDATDTGELLPLVGAEYVTGAEPQSLNGEPHARTGPGDPNEPGERNATQSIAYTFVLAHDPGHNHRIPKPAEYELHRREQPYTLTIEYPGARVVAYRMFERASGTPGAFWTYRRLIAAENFEGSGAPREISMINWPGNDYCAPGLLSSDPLRQAEALRGGKLASLGFAYWLQNEVPRDDVGKGYPGLELLLTPLGSTGGLSQFPYIRESRRIRALKTIQEQEISALDQKGPRAAIFPDSVGIGLYPIDIHGCAGRKFSAAAKPFQIPLGALIPQRIENLLASSKDIGTTHITNGAYRLHSVEWAIGEAAGTLASFAVDHGVIPRHIEEDDTLIQQLQLTLLACGSPVYWFDDLELGDPAFRAAQFLAARGIFGSNFTDLHFAPRNGLARSEAVTALARALRSRTANSEALAFLTEQGYLPPSLLNPGEIDQKLKWSDLEGACRKAGVEAAWDEGKRGDVTRADFAVWLERVYRRRAGIHP